MQTTIDEASVDQEHLESVNTELISAKLEIAQAKERITVLSKQINDLKNQNNATVCVFYFIELFIIFLFIFLDSKIQRVSSTIHWKSKTNGKSLV